MRATLLFIDRGNSNAEVDQQSGRTEMHPIARNGFAVSKACVGSEIEKISRARPVNLVHSHGLWSPLNHGACSFARSHRIPYVVSPRGMLEPWALGHRRWKKKLGWWLYQRRDIRGARCLHATSTAEATTLRSLGLRQPCAVITNGTIMPDVGPTSHQDDWVPKKLLFMSRLHPVKGLPNLVAALTRVTGSWECEIRGPEAVNGHRAEIEALVRQHQLHERVHFGKSLAGNDKWQALRDADVLVLPSHSENFGMVVAEALACGTPVITTKSTPWQDIQDHGCGWWVDNDVPSLAAALNEAITLPRIQLEMMGDKGRQLIQNRFTWGRIAEQMQTLYRWILGDGDEPSFLWK